MTLAKQMYLWQMERHLNLLNWWTSALHLIA